jgi:nicotinate phosphoribosyltransferase
MGLKTSSIYNDSLTLLTDFYQLTMVYGYWKSGMSERRAVFHLNFRKKPFNGNFAIAAGLQTAIDFIQAFKFSESDLDYLRSLNAFEPEFLTFLSNFKFSCDLYAMPEGTAVFPYEPLIRVEGPIWQAQLLETPLLNIINFQSLIATKASRICQAAYPDSVVEFGVRRAQGIDGGISASRASFIGGCDSTSNVIAGKLFSIPVRGTHAHSWVTAFDSEMEAFEAFGKVMPKGCVFLVDTYDSIEGTKKAIQVANKLKPSGFELAGIRLDSGDLAQLSIEIRKILDAAGFTTTKIMASNELDEYLIRDLKQQGAKIDVWGVGTHLVTAKEQPALDGIYKLSAIQDAHGAWKYKMKLSEQTAKVTNPGILQVRRYFDGAFYSSDAIYDEVIGSSDPCVAINYSDSTEESSFNVKDSKDLLIPIFKSGALVYESPTIQEMQAMTKSELSKFCWIGKRAT